MKATLQEQKRAESLLQSKGIRFHDIESFSFMKRYKHPRKSRLASKDKYGPGVLTLKLKQGTQKAFYIHSYQHPTALLRYLVSRDVPFENYHLHEKTKTEIPEKKYYRSSLYMFYFFTLFVMFAILGGTMVASGTRWAIFPGILSFVVSAFTLYALLFRFCYLTLNKHSIRVHSLARTVTLPYESLRKVNFDYSRQGVFTHIMETIDQEYSYRLFYIGRVSRRKLDEIAGYLKQAGIDATCSLDRNKRYYQDDYSIH